MNWTCGSRIIISYEFCLFEKETTLEYRTPDRLVLACLRKSGI
jgi:hypothetical protein